jgi:hypothetical protein
MRTAGDVYIARDRTVNDWAALRNKLLASSDPIYWLNAYEDYLHARLSLRYLEPIKVLRDNGNFQGEGFSIVAIHCTLIEFLESTAEGLNYRYRHRGDPPLGRYEYSDSSNLFVRFLTTRTPFASEFDQPLARDFYKNVRCGLLHEARTKAGWIIWGRSPNGALVSRTDKIIYRDDFHDGLLKFVAWYKEALIAQIVLQAAFIRKFDSLCT